MCIFTSAFYVLAAYAMRSVLREVLCLRTTSQLVIQRVVCLWRNLFCIFMVVT